jgi:hypothetical protein
MLFQPVFARSCGSLDKPMTFYESRLNILVTDLLMLRKILALVYCLYVVLRKFCIISIIKWSRYCTVHVDSVTEIDKPFCSLLICQEFVIENELLHSYFNVTWATLSVIEIDLKEMQLNDHWPFRSQFWMIFFELWSKLTWKSCIFVSYAACAVASIIQQNPNLNRFGSWRKVLICSSGIDERVGYGVNCQALLWAQMHQRN